MPYGDVPATVCITSAGVQGVAVVVNDSSPGGTLDQACWIDQKLLVYCPCQPELL